MPIEPEEANRLRLECNKKIDLEAALIRLEANQDFSRLVEEYTKNEPVRLVHLLGDPAFYADEKADTHNRIVKDSMIGIGKFVEYLRNVHNLANMARKTLEDLKSLEN